jgi:hypothetical protein
MKKVVLGILCWVLLAGNTMHAEERSVLQSMSFDFYGDTISISDIDAVPVDYEGVLTAEKIAAFNDSMNNAGFASVIRSLLQYKTARKPDDWLYYQLIRKTAQYFSPKADNYHRYTLYKWYFLTHTGYDATLSIAGDQLLFYVQCDENIFDIPCHKANGKQYVCLNYHDYGSIDLINTRFEKVMVNVPEASHAFSYKLTHLPGFTASDYEEKDLEFSYQDVNYKFRVKLNPNVKNIFANYPVADYELYFNMPMSSETYASLIPQLKENIRKMGTRQGVDYLMRFTRYAFLYQPDHDNFGKEKRLFAEQTLLYDGSDCEDRAALFFCLVKEIYHLPMIVLAYPDHVTIAVKFDKPIGTPIIYNGQRYTICEPTPQKEDVPIGKISKSLANTAYEVAYVYEPLVK